MKAVCDIVMPDFNNFIFEIVRKLGPRGKIETFGDHLGTLVSFETNCRIRNPGCIFINTIYLLRGYTLHNSAMKQNFAYLSSPSAPLQDQTFLAFSYS